MSKRICVLKASGRKEPFSEKKVRRSIRRAGVPSEIEEQAVAHILGLIYEGIPTKKIYQEILRFLEEASYPQGKSKYSLKQAVMALGPSGYPFEEFISKIFISQGYKTEVGTIVRGKCARHEIDVSAQKDKLYFLVECKFHNRPGIKTDIKVALYVKARFNDIIAAWKEKPGDPTELNQPWLVTNTKFTQRAIKYCECVGIRLLGWNYPRGDSLREWIQNSGFYPLTCLFSLSQNQKKRLLEEGIVLCRDLARTEPRLLRDLGLSSDSVKESIKEANLVSGV